MFILIYIGDKQLHMINPHFRRSAFDLIRNPFADDFEHKLYHIKLKKVDTDLKSLFGKLIPCEVECSLLDIKDSLISMGVSESDLDYYRNDFSEHLKANVNKIELRLDVPLFPKREKTHPISILISVIQRSYTIPRLSTPESVATLLMDISSWIPEYEAYIEGLIAKEKQRQVACQISLDALKRRIGEKVSEKGYQFNVHMTSDHKATFKIMMSDAVILMFDVNLLGDYMDNILQVVESLQITQYKPENVSENDLDDISDNRFEGLIHHLSNI